MPKVAAQWLRDILRTLYQRRTATRAEIIEATRLNPASVSHALRLLLQAGTILKVGELESNFGRRREVLNLNAEAAYFVAVDLEGTRIRFALTNLVGDIRYRCGGDLEFGQSLENATIVEGIEAVLKSLDAAQRARVLGIGISHPGIADDRGRVTAVNLNWSDFPLLEGLKQSLDLPIFLEDAHRTCILAERWLGAAQGSENCMYVIVGNGIGVGVFTEGHLLRGWHGMAGELGHIVIDPAAPDLCKCAKNGCLEALASCPNMVRQYREKTGVSANHLLGYRVTEVFERARQEDPVAIEIVDRAGKYLGLAFSYLVNLFNPQIIVIGGEVVQGEDLILPRLRAELERQAFRRSLAEVQVTMSSLGLDIGLKGAAALAFRSALLQPVLLKRLCSPLAAGHLHAPKKAGKSRRRAARPAPAT